jgi:hypothetical protein
MCREQFTAGGASIIEFGDLAVTLGVVVVRVDNHLAGERCDRYQRVTLQRNRHHDELSPRGGVIRGRG